MSGSGWEVINADCLVAMAAMEADSVDAVITDPPYDLTSKVAMTRSAFPGRYAGTPGAARGFMGKTWDGTGIAFDRATWEAVYRVAKPGAYLLAFGGPRTFHRMAVAIEDAGWLLRDTICWLYGSGFPKSKSLLKPAWEPIILARKPGPLRELNIDQCRVGTAEALGRTNHVTSRFIDSANGSRGAHARTVTVDNSGGLGRWPPNVLLSHNPPTATSPGCRLVGTRRVTLGESLPDAAHDGVNVAVVNDAADANAHVGQGAVEIVVPILAPDPVVHVGNVDFEGGALVGQIEVHHEVTAVARDDVLMTEVDTDGAQPLSDGELDSRDGERSAGRIGDAALMGNLERVGQAADDLAGAGTEETPTGSLDAVGRRFEVAPADETDARNLMAPSAGAVDVGAGARASDITALTQLSISDAVDGSADGTGPVVSRHGVTSEGDYTMRQLHNTEEVAAYVCEPDCPIALLDAQAGERVTHPGTARSDHKPGMYGPGTKAGTVLSEGSKGGASRFFPTFGPDPADPDDDDPGPADDGDPAEPPKPIPELPPEIQEAIEWAKRQGRIPPGPHGGHSHYDPDDDDPGPADASAGDDGGVTRAERGRRPGGFGDVGANKGDPTPNGPTYTDGGGPSRFFPTFPGSDDDGGVTRFLYQPKASRAEREAGLEGLALYGVADADSKPAGVTGMRSVDAGDYLDFIHPAPEGIGAWLRGHRERAGLSAKELCGRIGAHGEVNHGGAVSNWEAEYNRPTPDQWRALRTVLDFDDRHDEVMTATRPVLRELFDDRERAQARNDHPTVKSLALCDWLIRLSTPPGGLVLDCFSGSGSVGCSAVRQGYRFVGIDSDAHYCDIARRRLTYWSGQDGPLFRTLQEDE